MKKIPESIKKIGPYVAGLCLFFLVSAVYFWPVLTGDKTMGPGAAYTVLDSAGAWNDACFGGMPDTHFGQAAPGSPVMLLFFYMLGAYILLWALGCSAWVMLAGALAYGLSTFHLLLLNAGLNAQGWAIACMAPVLAGEILILKRNYWQGAWLLLCFALVHFSFIQPQITFYLGMASAITVAAFACQAFLQKKIKFFLCGAGLVLLIGSVSFVPSAAGWLKAYDYNKEAVCQQGPVQNKQESLTVLIPGFYGGSSAYPLGPKSQTWQVLHRSGQTAFARNAPLYWGAQPFSAGPVYMGAIVVFLFILGLFVVKGNEKWWLLGATIFSFVWSWMPLPPGFHFTFPAMALVIARLAMVVLACLALKTLIEAGGYRKKYFRDLYYAWGIVALFALFFAFFGRNMFGFVSPSDARLPAWLADALRADRMELLTKSALHAALWVSLSGTVLLFYLRGRMKSSVIALLLAAAVALDLGVVDRCYVGTQSFYPVREAALQPSEADALILCDSVLHYRVFNASANAFSDNTVSKFHKSVGGYHPFKLQRYQDIIDRHFSDGINPKVLNMLNVRYFIAQGNDGTPAVQRNVAALGNAWFVDSIVWVNSAREELEALYDFDPASTAVIDREWAVRVGRDDNKFEPQSFADTVFLKQYSSDYLVYEYTLETPRPLVFSEVYYKSWKAFIDGKEVPLYRVNYILRGLTAPAGKHTVEMRF